MARGKYNAIPFFVLSTLSACTTEHTSPSSSLSYAPLTTQPTLTRLSPARRARGPHVGLSRVWYKLVNPYEMLVQFHLLPTHAKPVISHATCNSPTCSPTISAHRELIPRHARVGAGGGNGPPVHWLGVNPRRKLRSDSLQAISRNPSLRGCATHRSAAISATSRP